jgi:hypothetical protein
MCLEQDFLRKIDTHVEKIRHSFKPSSWYKKIFNVALGKKKIENYHCTLFTKSKFFLKLCSTLPEKFLRTLPIFLMLLYFEKQKIPRQF